VLGAFEQSEDIINSVFEAPCRRCADDTTRHQQTRALLAPVRSNTLCPNDHNLAATRPWQATPHQFRPTSASRLNAISAERGAARRAHGGAARTNVLAQQALRFGQ
jgi:hypothetical protein